MESSQAQGASYTVTSCKLHTVDAAGLSIAGHMQADLHLVVLLCMLSDWVTLWWDESVRYASVGIAH